MCSNCCLAASQAVRPPAPAPQSGRNEALRSCRPPGFEEILRGELVAAGEGKQGEVPGPLDRGGHLALVLCTQAGAALDANKAAEAGEAAHSLKGSARNLRAGQLAKACEALEKMGKTGSLDDAATLLGQVEAELQKVTTLLEQQKKALGQVG